MSKGIWVLAEQKAGELTETTLEVLSEARRLADRLQEELSAVLMGHRVGTLAKTLGHYGAEKVYLAEDGGITRYEPEVYTGVVAGLIREHDPSIFLLGATCLGEDLAPRVSARVRTGLISNCDRLEITGEGLLLQRSLCYSGKVHASFVCPTARPQMATVQP